MSGAAQQYCLRWNNYQNNLTNVFDQLLQTEAFVDVTLACDGQSLKCHKMVLSACSPFFKNLFFDNPCSHPIVILKDIRWEELKAVVEFMYRGEINVSQEQLAPLLNVAEVLKIRGLADVSRSNNTDYGPSTSASGFPAHHYQQNSGSHHLESDTEGNGSSSKGHTPNGSTNNIINNNNVASYMASTLRRKRRKLSNTPNRSPSPTDSIDGHSSQHDIENNRDYDDQSPVLSFGKCDSSALLGGTNSSSNCSVNPTPPSTALPNSMNPVSAGASCPNPAAVASAASHPSNTAAAVAAAANFGGSMGSSPLLNIHNATSVAMSSVPNEMDLKPGIVEMIREEERAKMLESSHGWLPSTSSLSESYQYQIQSLWQKCWNTNQSGMVHALRFRERGPLKSWRPETMAEAIFAVLREGLSLSQAARKYDIPYPTFVLYANRVHNMLGPSADGCSSTDLISDIRPKGRGRPQRILLGTWPEDHIRGVIRAVVFRETGGKDDVPFMFNRDGGLCVPSQAGSSHNGLDMSLHQSFGGNGSGNGNVLFINPATQQQQQQQQQQQHSQLLNTSVACRSGTNDLQTGRGGGSPNLSSLSSAQLQELAEEQGNMSISRQHSSSSRGSSPMQNISNVLSVSSRGGSGSVGSLQQAARHLQHIRLNESSSPSPASIAGMPHLNFNKDGNGGEGGISDSDDVVMASGNPEIIQIKAEIPFVDDLDEDEEDVPDDLSNSDEDEIANQAVRVIASAVAAATANATSVVVSPSSSVSTSLTIHSPSGDQQHRKGSATGGSSANLMVHNSEGNNYLSDNDINTPPPHFQTS